MSLTPKDVPMQEQAHMNLHDCYVSNYANDELGIYCQITVYKYECGMVDKSKPSERIFAIRGVKEEFGTMEALLDYYNENMLSE